MTHLIYSLLNLVGVAICFGLMKWLGLWQGILTWTIALFLGTMLWTMLRLLIRDLRGDRKCKYM